MRLTIQVVVPYLVLAGLWFVVSDRLLAMLPLDSDVVMNLTAGKGIVFVFVTAFLLDIALRKQLRIRERDRERLKRSEERLRMIGDNLPDSYVYQYTREDDGTPRFLHLSSGVERIHGVRTEDALRDATLLMRQLTPEQMSSYREAEKTSFQNGSNFEMELHICRPDGESRWLMLRSHPHQSSNGYCIWDGVATDITTHVQTEVALRESETRLRLLIDAAPDAIFVQSKGRFRYLNRAAISLFGATRDDELIGTALMDRIAPEYRDLVLRRIRTQRETGKRVPLVEQDNLRLDGTRVPVETTAMPIMFQGEPSHLVFLRDVTARRQAQTERERLLAAIDQSSETIVITDTHGDILYVNPAFERVTGFSRAEAIGQNPRVLKSGKHDKTFYRELWSTILTGKTWRGNLVNKRKDGTLFTEDASISPVRDAAGNIVNFVAVKRDITEHLHLSAQLAQAQKMEWVGQLAGGVAHDFNNMLSVILGNVELAMSATDAQAPVFADLQEIRKAAERSADLTRQLLAFARKQAVSPKVLDLNDTVSAMLRMLHRLIGEHIELHWRPCAQDTTVRIDPSQLDQILANLCVNARDAIRGVGEIHIETSLTTLTATDCAGQADDQAGEYVTLAVRDDGCGMDANTLEHIFEPFFTTKEVGEGTGLGLATVYGIVRQNGGSIDVHSAVAEGTTFTIRLPHQQPQPAPRPTPDPAEATSAHHETVLLVEDEPAILELGTRKLKKLGYRVLAAKTPSEALALAQRDDVAIDLLVTDVVMPQMSGWDLATKLREQTPDLHLIFMSGYAANAVSPSKRPFPDAHFIQKPFTLKTLANTIAETLSNSRARSC